MPSNIRILELRAQKTKLINSASSLAVKGLRTQEARDSYAAIEKQIADLDEDIAMIELIAAKQDAAAIDHISRKLNDPTMQPPAKRSVEQIPAEVARYLNLNPDGTEKKKLDSESRAFRSYLSQGFTPENRDLLTTADTTGGALIPQEYASFLVEARKHYGAILNYAQLKYSSRPTKFEFIDDSSNDIVLASEANEFVNTGNDPIFGSATPAALDLFKTLAVRASYELVDDSAFNVAEFLKRVALKRYFRGISRLLISGKDAAGTTAPNVVSLLSLLATNPNVVTTTTLADGIKYGDLVNLIESLDVDYFANSAFILNQSTLNNLRSELDGFGRPFYAPNPTADSASFATLLGRPVIIDPSVPSIGASAYPVILADLSQTLGVQVNTEVPAINVFRETHAETLEALYSSTSRIASVALLPNKALSAIKLAAS